MPSVTYDNWGRGLDVRREFNAPVNTLSIADNVYIDDGYTIKKRPAFCWVQNINIPNSKGLFAKNNNLFVVSADKTINGRIKDGLVYGCGSNTVNNDLRINEITHTYQYGVYTIVEDYPKSFYSNSIVTAGTDIDANARLFTDMPNVNRPQSKYISVVLENHIFSAPLIYDKAYISSVNSENVVRYNTIEVDSSGYLVPTNWGTGTNFLRFNKYIYRLAKYRGYLAVIFEDEIQLWKVDADPAKFSLYKTIDGVGSVYPLSVTNMGEELIFKAKNGFRCITYSNLNDNILSADIGTPIDKEVLKAYEKERVLFSDESEMGLWENGYYHSQSNTFYGISLSSPDIFVYKNNPLSKSNNWTHWTVRTSPRYLAEINGEIYFRAGHITNLHNTGLIDTAYINNLYKIDNKKYMDKYTATDAGYIECKIETQWLDFKSQGILKILNHLDIIGKGTVNLSIAFDPEYPDDWQYLGEYELKNYSGGLIPINLHGVSFKLRIEHRKDEDLEIKAMTYYFENLGAV